MARNNGRFIVSSDDEGCKRPNRKSYFIFFLSIFLIIAHQLESIDDQMDDHKAEPLLKLCMEKLDPTLTMSPMAVQKKLLLKASRTWIYNQRQLNVISVFSENQTFETALKHGYTFMCCLQTKNLVALNDDSADQLGEFLINHGLPYIWCTARGYHPKGRSVFSAPSYDYIEILDLNYANKDRENPIKVKCPMFDIIFAVTIEEDKKVCVLASSEFFNLGTERHNKIIRIKKDYKSYFVSKPMLRENSFNDSQINPGTSGMTASEITASERPEPMMHEKQTQPSTPSQIDTPTGDSHAKDSQPKDSEPKDSEPKDSEPNAPQSQTERPKKMMKEDLRGRPVKKMMEPGQFNRVEFSHGFIKIVTESESKTFAVQDIKDHRDLLSKKWLKDTVDDRKKQWDKFICEEFDLFDLVREKKADHIVFIRMKDCISTAQMTKIKSYWNEAIEAKFPPNLCYILFDRARFYDGQNIPYTARALCGIEYLPPPNDSADLPDCQIFRIMKKGNFANYKTLFNVEAFTEHIDRHRTKMHKSKFNRGPTELLVIHFCRLRHKIFDGSYF